ncbi:two-component sensor histidine kinase [Lentzea tibetensis]|uniref:histidine kinase n=1 Tax=Lentzea tibetensis TaxID=2591470 RepID=A0A563EIC3_9PSEU|nr:histidine kinase [Lentzea tibetensis]TWP46444.1 two-component sensor histidine kinase [Lentzea tibetensis]
MTDGDLVRQKIRPGELVLAVLALLVGLLPLGVPLPISTHPAMAVVTAICAAALVPLARRKPVLAMLATTLLYASTNFWAITTTTFVIFTAARLITPRGRLWLTVLGTGVGQVVFSSVNYLIVPTPLTRADVVGGTVFGLIFLLLLPALAGMLLGQRKPLTRLLQERNEYLERAQALTASKARTEERSHIAGEMHDMLGHRLSLISIHAGALELMTSKQAPELHEQAELVRTTSSVAMAELREILGVLRANTEPETLDENAGTREDVLRLVESSCAAGISVRLEWHGDDVADADPRSRRAIHRVVREGLTNVHKHAPDARARVSVTVSDGRAEVLVVNSTTDAPKGKGTRRGLIGLEERVGLIGGRFVAGPAPEGGFRIAADLPLHPAALADAAVTGDAVPEVPPVPIVAESLTLPRVVASGCLGAMVGVPVLGSLVVILVVSAVGGGAMDAGTFVQLQLGTEETTITEQYGIGTADAEGCLRYRQNDGDQGQEYKLCFQDGKLARKDVVAAP